MNATTSEENAMNIGDVVTITPQGTHAWEITAIDGDMYRVWPASESAYNEQFVDGRWVSPVYVRRARAHDNSTYRRAFDGTEDYVTEYGEIVDGDGNPIPGTIPTM